MKDEGEETKWGYKWPKFVVMGHRGSGMNMLQSSDAKLKSIKENSILSFNAAAQFPIDFVEFDVQVSVIFVLLWVPKRKHLIKVTIFVKRNRLLMCILVLYYILI